MARAVIVFSDRANRELDEARAWWQAHIHTSELDDAVAAALDRLELFPELASRVPRRGHWTTTRRYVLERVGYHLYYKYTPRTGTILVLCFWHERRRKPRL
jgi:plasmid stabilization system protein ParE